MPFPSGDEGAEAEFARNGHRFSLLELTSGFPDDSPEADERARERHVRNLRASVKAGRARGSTTPGLAEIL